MRSRRVGVGNRGGGPAGFNLQARTQGRVGRGVWAWHRFDGEAGRRSRAAGRSLRACGASTLLTVRGAGGTGTAAGGQALGAWAAVRR